MHPCLVNNRFYKGGFLGGLFGGGSTPSAPVPPPPPPPVPTPSDSAAAAVQQTALHADPNGVTYASTLLTGAAQPVSPSSVSKNILLGG